MSTQLRKRFFQAGLLPLILLGASATFAGKLSEDKFTMARMAIDEAQEVNADASAGSELTLAEQKLQQAVEYNDRGRDKVAERLLRQSMLHAELAEVEGLQADADLSLKELTATLNSLETEIRRQ